MRHDTGTYLFFPGAFCPFHRSGKGPAHQPDADGFSHSMPSPAGTPLPLKNNSAQASGFRLRSTLSSARCPRRDQLIVEASEFRCASTPRLQIAADPGVGKMAVSKGRWRVSALGALA